MKELIVFTTKRDTQLNNKILNWTVHLTKNLYVNCFFWGWLASGMGITIWGKGVEWI